jgi:hypothetical protein
MWVFEMNALFGSKTLAFQGLPRLLDNPLTTF